VILGEEGIFTLEEVERLLIALKRSDMNFDFYGDKSMAKITG
jgi:hypothetical protein